MSKEPYEQIDLKALRCFETMARHGSLTKAGIELGISDAAVSQRVKSLERYLGTKLYESRGGRVRLTDAGRRTKDLATRLFDELAEFEEGIGQEESRRTVVLAAEAPRALARLDTMLDKLDDYLRPGASGPAESKGA